jgi:hypothetical protein
MADEWYYTNQGQQAGPVSSAELKQLAETQRLQPTDLVWREGLPNWIPARSAKGLFPETPAAATTTAPAPTPVAPVDEPQDLDADLRPPRRRGDGEDDYERPRRRRRYADEDDDLADRPARRRRAASGSNKGLIIGLAIGGGVLLLGGVGLVVVLVIVGAGSSGSGSYTVSLGPGQENVRNIHFKSGAMVEIWVKSDHNTHTLQDDVDLFVLDPSGLPVAQDTRIDADCYVQFMPPQTGSYRVILHNIGRVSNRSHVTYKQ